MTERSPADRLYRICEEGLCIGCGLCESVAGSDKIEIVRTPEGALRPVATDALEHAAVDQIYATCPGTRVEGLPDDQVGDAREDLVWGKYHDVVKAHAGDPRVRFEAAAGGVLTALAVYLLESGTAEFVVHARMPSDAPSFGVRHVSRTRDDVLRGAGSRYGPTATLIDIRTHLAEERPFGFIGTPCDISALRNLARTDERVDRYCVAMLTPVCGGFMETPALAKAVAGFGMDFERLTAVRYRDHGCPGPTRLEQDDGTVREKTYLDFWGEDDSAWSLPWRCKICPDGIGEAADIAAADCWPGGAPTREQAEDHRADPGSNGVLIRSARGAALWRAAAAAGAIVEESRHAPRDMDDWQPHQVTKKKSVRARFDGMAAAGRLVPQTARLRLDALYDTRDPDEAMAETEGTERRIRAGKATEPRPVKAGRIKG